MATIQEHPRLEGEKAYCSLCGTNLVNYGAYQPANPPITKDFFCCRACALEQLPQLIIDALGENEVTDTTRMNNLLDPLILRLWRRVGARRYTIAKDPS